jgi:hypothetical protein
MRVYKVLGLIGLAALVVACGSGPGGGTSGETGGDGDIPCVNVEEGETVQATDLSITQRDGQIAVVGFHGFADDEAGREVSAFAAEFDAGGELMSGRVGLGSSDDDSWRELNDVTLTDGAGFRAVGYDETPGQSDLRGWLRIGGEGGSDVHLDADEPERHFELYSVNQVGSHTIAVGKQSGQEGSFWTVISFDGDGGVEWKHRVEAQDYFADAVPVVDLGDGELLVPDTWEVLDAGTGEVVSTPPPLAALADHEDPEILAATADAPVVLSTLSACAGCETGVYEVLFLDEAFEVQTRWEVPVKAGALALDRDATGVFVLVREDDSSARVYHLVDGDADFEAHYCENLSELEAVDDKLLFTGSTGPEVRLVARVTL